MEELNYQKLHHLHVFAVQNAADRHVQNELAKLLIQKLIHKTSVYFSLSAP